MQKILSVVWFKIFPAHFGGQKGIAGFYKSLSHYYSIDCLCSEDNISVQESTFQTLALLPRGKWQFINPLVWNKILRLYRKNRYSHIIIEFPYYSFIGTWLRRKGAFFILHAHNIEGKRFRNLRKRGWRLMELYEKWGMKRADLVLFKTRKDKQYAIENYGLKEELCYVLPSGISNHDPSQKEQSRRQLEQKHQVKPGEKILLFAGTLDYLPNAEAVQTIYDHLVPLLVGHLSLPFKIIICGRNYMKQFSYLQDLKNEHVVQAGFVDDIEVYFLGADVFINPVQTFDGVQTKTLDALSYHLNVVGYEQGSEGLPSYLLGKKVFLASDDLDFVHKIQQALDKKEDTPAIFFEEFDWDNIVRNFVKELEAFKN